MNEYIDYIAIGKRIKAARDTKSMSQEKLAEIMDISPSYLSQLENGKAEINLFRLSQICEILSCDFIFLLTGTVRIQTDYLQPEFHSLLRDKSPDEKKQALDFLKIYFREN